MTMCCLKESEPPSSDGDGDDTNLEVPNQSEVVICNPSSSKKSLNSLISLLTGRKVKQIKLSNFING